MAAFSVADNAVPGNVAAFLVADNVAPENAVVVFFADCAAPGNAVAEYPVADYRADSYIADVSVRPQLAWLHYCVGCGLAAVRFAAFGRRGWKQYWHVA